MFSWPQNNHIKWLKNPSLLQLSKAYLTKATILVFNLFIVFKPTRAYFSHFLSENEPTREQIEPICFKWHWLTGTKCRNMFEWTYKKYFKNG